jgi:hypothetical protein
MVVIVLGLLPNLGRLVVQFFLALPSETDIFLQVK